MRWGCRAALAALLIAGCAHVPPNAPLAHHQPGRGYRYPPPVAAGQAANADSLLVILTFSGGGTRAAAFSFGVLEALREKTIYWQGEERRLLDEVDIIAAVSGGSVAAAHYALYGERSLDTFAEDFLERDVQGALLARTLLPRNLFRLLSPRFGRSDLLAEYLDHNLFDGATFTDLQGKRPYVMISATDISLGIPFTFTQGQLDLLCTDLARFPLARAVAASSAVPVLLTPVTLRNHGGCAYEEPPWVAEALEGAVAARRRRRAAAVRSYLDVEARPYIHLLDGGLADNLGLQSLFDGIFSLGNDCELVELLQLDRVRRVLLVAVNAVTELDRSADQRPRGPSLAQIIWAAANVPIDRHSFQTLDTLKSWLGSWSQEVAACLPPGTTIDTFPVVVNFDAIADARTRDALKRVPTGLYLPADTVTALRRAAGLALTSAAELRRFLATGEAAP